MVELTPFFDSDGRMRMTATSGGQKPHEQAAQFEEAEREKAKPIQDKLDARTAQQAKLSEMSTMLKGALEATKSLAASETTVLRKSAFDKTVVFAVDTTTGEASKHVTLLVTGTPPPQTIKVDSITQIAAQDTKMGTSDLKVRDYALSANALTGKTTALGWAGNLILGYEGETATQTLLVDAGWSLETLATQIDGVAGFNASAVLQKGTTDSWELLIQAGDGNEGKVLTIDSSAVTGTGAGQMPEARLDSVTEAGTLAATTTALFAPPLNTFDESTDSITGLIDGTFKSVTVTGSGPYSVSVNVETDFGTTTLTDSNFTVGAGNTLTLTHPTTGATFSVDCGVSVTSLTSAYDVTIALKQMFGIGSGSASTLVSPSAGFSNGLATGGISADDSTLAAGTYSVKYDQASKTAILNNGSQTWASAVVGAGGAQVITVNGVTLALDAGFDYDTNIGEIKFDVTDNGLSKLKSHSETAGWSGILKVGTTDNVPVDITIERGMSLDKIVSVINAESDRSGVLSRIVGERLELFTQETAKALSVNISGLTGVTTGNILAVSHADPSTIKDGLSTKYTVNGVLNTIPNNKTELVKGLTVEFAATTNNPINVTIDQDANQIAESIVDVVNSMNEFLAFAKKQQTDTETLPDNMTPEEKAEYGALRGDSVLRSIHTEMFAAFTSTVPGINPTEKISNLADIGIKYNAPENRFDIDNGKLTDAIANKTKAVTKIFAFVPDIDDHNAILVSNMKNGWLTGVDPKDPSVDHIDTLTVSIVRQTNGILSADFKVDGESYTAEVKSGDSLVYFNGAKNSLLEGLSIAYPIAEIANDSSISFDISATQGIAENMKAIIERVTSATEGSIKLQSDAIIKANERSQIQIDKVYEAAKKSGERIRDVLIQVAKAQQEAARLMKQVEDFKEAFKPRE